MTAVGLATQRARTSVWFSRGLWNRWVNNRKTMICRRLMSYILKYGPQSRKRNLKSLVFILNKGKHNHSCNQHYCCRIHGTVRQRDIDRFCDDIRCCFEYPWTSPWKKSCNVYSNVCMKCFTIYLVRNDLINQCNQSINVSKPWDRMSKIRVMALASDVSYRLSVSGRSKFERHTYTCSHYMYMWITTLTVITKGLLQCVCIRKKCYLNINVNAF